MASGSKRDAAGADRPLSPTVRAQWVHGATEESLFADDGLLQLASLLRPPEPRHSGAGFDRRVYELLVSDSVEPAHLSREIENICQSQSNICDQIAEYRMQAVAEKWRAHDIILSRRHNRIKKVKRLQQQAKHKKTPFNPNTFSNQLSLQLLFPLLQSQSQQNARLRATTLALLQTSLAACPPLSLDESAEGPGVIDGLEDLLCTWVQDSESEAEVQQAATSLATLCCARTSIPTVVRGIELLLNLPEAKPLVKQLPVGQHVDEALRLCGGSRQPQVLDSLNHHVETWKYEDGLNQMEVGGVDQNEKQVIHRPDIATDGEYLYVTRFDGCGLAKMGSGLRSTVRGRVYARNHDFSAGFVAYASDKLVFRTLKMDETPLLLSVLDRDSLQLARSLTYPEVLEIRPELKPQTLNLSSDGYSFFLVRRATVPDEYLKYLFCGHVVIVDVFTIEPDMTVQVKKRTFLERGYEGYQRQDLFAALLAGDTETLTSSEAAPEGPYVGIAPVPQLRPSTSVRIGLPTLNTFDMWASSSFLHIIVPASFRFLTDPNSDGISDTRDDNWSTTLPKDSRDKIVFAALAFDLDTGLFHSRSELVQAGPLAMTTPFWAGGHSHSRGTSLTSTAVSYDARNNKLFVATGAYIDVYDSAGVASSERIRERLQINDVSSSLEVNRNVEDTLTSLMQHVGMRSLVEVERERKNAQADSKLESSSKCNAEFVTGIVKLFQKITPQTSSDKQHLTRSYGVLAAVLWAVSSVSEQELTSLDLQKLVTEFWQLLAEPVCSESKFFELLSDVICVLVRRLCEGDPGYRRTFLMKRQFTTTPGTLILKNKLLKEELDSLSLAFSTDEILAEVGNEDFIEKIFSDCENETRAALTESTKPMHPLDVKKRIQQLPRVSLALKYCTLVVKKILNTFCFHPDEARSRAALEQKLMFLLDTLFSCFERLLVTSEKTFQALEQRPDEALVEYLDMTLSSSLLGVPLLLTLTCLNFDRFLNDLERIRTLVQRFSSLLVSCRDTAFVRKKVLRMCFAGRGHNEDTRAEESDDEDADDDDSEEEPGFIEGEMPLLPWDYIRIMESIHPIRETNCKIRDTVCIPGASQLYLYFDHRCATQYDYDKLTVHAGKTHNSRKIAEFGGNKYGMGNKSVLGDGWPKATEPLIVDGDSVTVALDTRSTREGGTLDKAIWGFKILVLASDQHPKYSPPPVLIDLSVTLTSLIGKYLKHLYNGTELTKEEKECEFLLRSKLLQRCIWKSASTEETSDEAQKPALKSSKATLSNDQLVQLRSLSQTRMPPLRAGAIKVMKPEQLEKIIMSAVVKHLSLQDILSNFSQHKDEDTADFYLLNEVMIESYQKYYALIRRLQVLADLENQWENEVDDLSSNLTKLEEVFFIDYQSHEVKAKDLELLCFLKGIDTEENDLPEAVELLLKEIEKEARLSPAERPKDLQITKKIVSGIIDRVSLLLKVSINTGIDTRDASGSGAANSTRSLQGWPSQHSAKSSPSRGSSRSRAMLTRQQSAELDRHLDESILHIPRLRQQSSSHKRTARSIIKDLSLGHEDASLEEDSKAPEAVVLDQLFAFIGTSPEKAVAGSLFLKAAMERKKRSRMRIQALAHMKHLLLSCEKVGGSTLLFPVVCSILKHGPKAEELTCGSLIPQVRDGFSDVLTVLVNIANNYPLSCKNGIGLLSVIPYSKSEESCLVRSGLVPLLDSLCGMHDASADDMDIAKQSERHRLSKMAWAAFKVLAHRCVEWEEKESAGHVESGETSGLAKQVSDLITNHLIQAATSGSSAINCNALQEVLTLLTSLSLSKLGKDIVSQPTCLSKLMELLLEPRLSPKMILTIARLCHVALPLISVEDCRKLAVPNWSIGSEDITPKCSNNILKIVHLLVAKIADFIVPGCQVTVAQPRDASNDTAAQKAKATPTKSVEDQLHEVATSENILLQERGVVSSNVLALYVHKRDDQTPQDIVQQLLGNNNELRLFRPVDSMDNAVRLDRDLTRHNKVEVVTEDATLIFRKAVKLAQHGFVVSIGPALKEEMTEQMKLLTEQICKERNVVLARHDPQRPFMSSQVANGLAAEVIGLLHSLLRCRSAQVWRDAVYEVISNGLKAFHNFIPMGETIVKASQRDLFNTFKMGREILACLAALGSFEETLKPGMEVSVLSEHGEETPGFVYSFNMSTHTAKVRFPVEPGKHWTVSLDRIIITDRLQTETTNLFLPLGHEIVAACQELLLPDATHTDHLSTALPASGDGKSLRLMSTRLYAEVCTQGCRLLSIVLQHPAMVSQFLQRSCYAVDMLKCLSKDCLPSDRLAVVSASTMNLRSVYRDCVKPLAPPRPVKKEVTTTYNSWNPHQVYPPLKAVLFTHQMTGITYYTEPVMAPGLPRGAMVYASQPFSAANALSYYEVHVLSLGDTSEAESGTPILSIGVAPNLERRELSFSNPVGTVLCHNNGRAVHYNGASLLHWRSLRFDGLYNPGDTIGVGWEKVDGSGPVKGNLFFTHNGRRLESCFEGVDAELYPVVHIQKKDIRLRANFGQQNFAYSEVDTTAATGDQSKLNQMPSLNPGGEDAAPAAGNFTDPPFDLSSGGSQDAPDKEYTKCAGHSRLNNYLSRPALKYRPRAQYEADLAYRARLAANPAAATGPFQTILSRLDDDTDDDEDADEDTLGDEEHHSQQDNINALLVRAWESKVFPIIRRRFRNDTERRDGLDQIKGALSMGMADIARQTVEFLYEENGGIPNDLALPTINDIKEQMSKFSIDGIRKGDSVLLNRLAEPQPHFASFSQLKTFGLIGEVLEVDKQNELVQVETYLKAEGTLVRFWYPISYLGKPPDADKSKAWGELNVSSCGIHRELLNHEYILTRLYCRESYLQLLKHSSAEPGVLGFCDGDESTPEKNIASSLQLLQDIDLENMLHISNASLALPVPSGNQLDSNLTGQDSKRFWQDRFSNFIDSLFSNSHQLRRELARVLEKADSHSDQGESHLLELTDQVCMCMQHVSDYFHEEKITINDVSTLKSLIQFKEAAFLTVAVKIDLSLGKFHPPDLLIQIHTMDNLELKKNGLNSPKDVIQFPVTLKANGGLDSHIRAFPTLLIAADTLRISHSGGGESNVCLRLLGIPQQLPLAFAYIEELLKHAAMTNVTSEVISRSLVHLSSLVFKLAMPLDVKQHCLVLLARLVRTLRLKDPSRTSLSQSVFKAMYSELLELHEFEEAQKLGRFSEYLQSLFEVMAAAEEMVPRPTQLKKDEAKRAKEELSEAQASAEAVATSRDEWVLDALDSLQVLKTLSTGRALDLFNVPKVEKELQAKLSCLTSNSRRYLLLLNINSSIKDEDIAATLDSVVPCHGGFYKDKRPEIIKLNEDEGQQEQKAVLIQLAYVGKRSVVKEALKNCLLFKDCPDFIAAFILSDFTCEEEKYTSFWREHWQRQVLVEEENGNTDVLLKNAPLSALEEVFQQCYLHAVTSDTYDIELESGEIRLHQGHILRKHPDNPMCTFFEAMSEDKVKELMSNFGQKTERKKSCSADLLTVTLSEFTRFVAELTKKEVLLVLKAFSACGYDLHFQKVTAYSALTDESWTRRQDEALVALVNHIAYETSVSPAQLDASEIHMTEEDCLSTETQVLSGLSRERLASRFALLNLLNSRLQSHLLPLTLQRGRFVDKALVAGIVSDAKELIFTDTKTEILHHLIDSTAFRSVDHVAPVVDLDPVSHVGKMATNFTDTWFYQAMVQLSDTASDLFCVAKASGGDPKFPFQVVMSGEEVHGTSGSFRHILSKVPEELHSPIVNLTVPYQGPDFYKGRYFMKSGPLNFHEEKLLLFLGQLIGIAIRSGIPFVLQLMPTFWQCLQPDAELSEADLAKYDPVATNYLASIMEPATEEAFETFLEEQQYPKFAFATLSGRDVELCEGGHAKYLSFQNRTRYCNLVRSQRLEELRAESRMIHIRAGLASILPIDVLLNLYTPVELEELVCGSCAPVSVDYLRSRTIYQAGLTEEDDHIRLFWSALRSLSKREMSKFIKFSSNQERLPFTRGESVVPPFPMKIAPYDRSEGNPDAFNLRVETCMFMVKVPRYSSIEVMRSKILFAINSANDPLSG